jgi:hypothetical protein
VILALVVGLIAYVLTLIVDRAPMIDAAIKQIIRWVIFAVAALVILLALLQALGVVAGGPIVIAR